MADPTITIRMTTQADIDTIPANASVGESAAVDVNGKLVAVVNEYGTAETRDPDLQDPIERMIEAAGDVWKFNGPITYNHDRAWVLVVHDVDTDIIWDVYNHEPTEEDIHFMVIEFYDRCHYERPHAKSGTYYGQADMPDHTGYTIGRLGSSLASPLST